MERQHQDERRGRTLSRRDSSRKKDRGHSASSRRPRSRRSRSSHRRSHGDRHSRSLSRRNEVKDPQSPRPFQLEVMPVSSEPPCVGGCVDALEPLPDKEPACSGGCVRDESIIDAFLNFLWGRCADDLTQMEGYEIHTDAAGDRHRTKTRLRKQHQQARSLREPHLRITIPGSERVD